VPERSRAGMRAALVALGGRRTPDDS